MLLRLVIAVLAATVATVVLAVPLDDAEARQAVSGSNFTISEDDLDRLVEEIRDQLGITDEEVVATPAPVPPASVGNILYSVTGFILGGLMFFVSIFDTTRKPVINFFDGVFGGRQVRRRREVSEGLEARVSEVFQAFTSAVDKMNAVLKVAKDLKK